MMANGVGDDRQPQTGAGAIEIAGRVAAMEGLEYLHQFGFRNAWAAVLFGQCRLDHAAAPTAPQPGKLPPSQLP